MKVEHIIEILDNTPLGSLSAEQLDTVQRHSQTCSACERAYQAALLSSVVIKERAQTPIEPPAFFETRVMAAWRERQTADTVPVLSRLWKSAGALVASMAVTTVALAGLSFVVTTPVTTTTEETASAYSAEAVILGQGTDDQMSYEQVLSAIYVDDEGK